MRGPPMPANSMPGRRAFSAAIRWAASRSPEASPATMATRKGFARISLLIALADDAALATVEKFDDLFHRGAYGDLLAQLGAGLLEAECAAVQRAVSALQARDRLGREATALQPLAIDAVRPRHVSGRGDVRRQVLRQVGAHAGEGMRADVNELVDERRGTEDCPVAHGDVPCELAGVGEDGVIADLAVVREMHVSHDPVVVADPRDADIERGAAIHRDVLADGVAVADLDRRVLAAILLVLRRRAERGKMEDLVVAADLDAAVEHDVRADPCALAHLDLRTDDAVRTDRDVARELRRGVDQRRPVDLAHLPAIPCMAQRIVASATTWPTTRATQPNLLMPRNSRSMCTSISSWSPGTTGFLKRALSIPT